MTKKVLITGGSGLIGSHLSKYLKEKGIEVSILGRKKTDASGIFFWDIEKKEIDKKAFEGVEVIIHLAGAGIGDHRWTEKYKREIVESRVASGELLFETLKKIRHQVHTFISASGVGYYGDSGENVVDESAPNGDDFLAQTCKLWEASAKQFESLGLRVVIFRQGHVFTADGGVLPVFAKPVKLFVGSPLGSGEQYLSWIHVHDLCRFYHEASMNKNMKGIFNAVSPHPVKNKDFTKMLSKTLHRPFWHVRIPAGFLHVVLGEQAFLILEGQNADGSKAGIDYQRTELISVLEELKK